MRQFYHLHCSVEFWKTKSFPSLRGPGFEDCTVTEPKRVMRASELYPTGQLFMDGVGSNDITQGAVGDCFFIGRSARWPAPPAAWSPWNGSSSSPTSSGGSTGCASSRMASGSGWLWTPKVCVIPAPWLQPLGLLGMESRGEKEWGFRRNVFPIVFALWTRQQTNVGNRKSGFWL